MSLRRAGGCQPARTAGSARVRRAYAAGIRGGHTYAAGDAARGPPLPHGVRARRCRFRQAVRAVPRAAGGHAKRTSLGCGGAHRARRAPLPGAPLALVGSGPEQLVPRLSSRQAQYKGVGVFVPELNETFGFIPSIKSRYGDRRQTRRVAVGAARRARARARPGCLRRAGSRPALRGLGSPAQSHCPARAPPGSKGVRCGKHF